ncbi:hypothetical protein [Yinghuangia seranimata]|uniref:hypothetical protein n=1 Tax=Yinghuangia seranimata TaxID=408067 RepID=UPI00248BFB0A|nr:hypothetical protein [Yinghuangia seranimata]MDI2129425.1 hypothetical protein [Yinghuangia seranimata]
MFLESPAVNWDAVPVEEALEQYDMAEASNRDSWDVDEYFGEEPEHFYVHRGDLTIDGALALGNAPGEDEDTVYVIDGDLTVNGPITFCNADVYTTLYVTGSVVAQDLVCLWDSLLFVDRSLTVRNLLATSLYDPAALVVKGPVSAHTWLEMGGRGCIYFADKPATDTCIRGHLNEYAEGANADVYLDGEAKVAGVAEAVLPEFLYEDRFCKNLEILEAVHEGRPVLR